jgi:peptidoglycan hydrolase-like protein with peptidoglycan-binding domain
MGDRRRTLLTVSAVAVLALATGVVAGQFVTSPADAAARTEAPEAGAITVPVELRALESRVVTRGDASFAGSVELSVELSGLEVPPVVTGSVPKAGDELDDGDVALEIAGRPVILLDGPLPMYRTLRPGMTGPDVKQLEKALARLGFDPGTVDDTYTAATGRAVAALFEGLGYEAPAPDAEARADLDAARDALRMAEDDKRSADQALAAASRGPSKSEKVAADQAVDAAQRALKAAEEVEDADRSDAIAEAKSQLALAQAQRDEVLTGPDTSGERAAVDAAQKRLADAQAALSDAQAAAGTPLPAAEVMYAAGLPRRVDEIAVKRGEQVEGTVMSVSGADIVVVATVRDSEREHLAEDMPAVLDLPTGESVDATITDISAAGDGGGYQVEITPDELTAEQVDALRSANVRVTIPVTSTDGDVLAVPLAALTAGPGGEARVEIERGGEIVLVEVEVGLTADGYAEVVAVDGDLGEGDLVVVGQ